MRKNSIILIVPFLISLLAVSGCHKWTAEELRKLLDETKPEPAVVEESIPGAPQADNACRIIITSESSEIRSISFSEGGIYRVAYKTGNTVANKYSFSDDVYTMNGFGTARFVGTKGGSLSESSDKVILTFEDQEDATVLDCTVQKNPNNKKNLMFRSWKIKEIYLCIDDDAELTLKGLNFDKLASQLTLKGITTNGFPPGAELKSIDISGTGEFTGTFKLINVVDLKEAFVGTWSDINDEEDTFLLDWEDSFIELMDRGEDPKPFKLSYGCDYDENDELTLGLLFTLKTKNNKGKEVAIDCLLSFLPND